MSLSSYVGRVLKNLYLKKLVTGDYLEMWVKNATSTADITVEYANVIVKVIS